MWRQLGLTVVVYLILLNGLMRGRKRLQIDAFLSLAWVVLIVWSVLVGGWRGGLRVIAGSFVIGIPLLILARLAAGVMRARLHQDNPAIALGVLAASLMLAGSFTLLYQVLGISWFFN